MLWNQVPVCLQRSGPVLGRLRDALRQGHMKVAFLVEPKVDIHTYFRRWTLISSDDSYQGLSLSGCVPALDPCETEAWRMKLLWSTGWCGSCKLVILISPLDKTIVVKGGPSISCWGSIVLGGAANYGGDRAHAQVPQWIA
jgi:hypothetical protein